MRRMRRRTHKISYKKAAWHLEEKKRFLFFPYWKTLLTHKNYEKCVNALASLTQSSSRIIEL